MTRRPGTPMPPALRAVLTARHHPARTAPCPHCDAAPGRPCHNRSRTRQMPQPHPSRITAWAVATAVCPTCQTTPGTPCHHNGHALRDHHSARETEARRTAA